ncbi:heparan-alpha-glucosaminide N-acetyltransferase-like isoform X1 [Panicum virgatum]|uniref:heparan-alpha-glucosaminide N-acetyltransferase-like isoform X1 n=1 Tax=Panicum virgatum TaxID=38727 RepID=UPI0019D5A562|nr:heparan-alpha-glucosaminide N-acetyltransferase-like isoform X1 [Panicum virgatum]
MDATVVAIAGGGDDSVRRPLVSLTEEIHPYAEPPSPQRPLLDAAAAQPEQQRVASLDVFRGFTVAMMILVDDAGGACPGINHAPWFGVTVADFVMPAFLFIIGVSAALAFKMLNCRKCQIRRHQLRRLWLGLSSLILVVRVRHARKDPGWCEDPHLLCSQGDGAAEKLLASSPARRALSASSLC